MRAIKSTAAAGFFIFVFLVCCSSTEAQIQVVDGCLFKTRCIPLFVPNPGFFPLEERCWALPLVEDCWTKDIRGNLNDAPDDEFERETYLFPTFDSKSITFINKIKLSPQLDQPIVAVVAEDIFIIPCNPKCPNNPMGEDFPLNNIPPLLIIDDVTFPPITLDPFQGVIEVLCAVQIPIQVIDDFFKPILGPSYCVDWWKCVDLDATGEFYKQPPSDDLDGNGCPDVCVELQVPGKFVPRIGLDECGAELLDFLLNRQRHNLTKVAVHEPRDWSFFPPFAPDHPFFAGVPTHSLPGMKQGEDMNTRPWCFNICQICPLKGNK